MKSIRLIWLFFSVCMLACADDASEVAGGNSEILEQVVLKLNVQKETIVQTRAITAKAEEVNTIDFFIFNAKGDMVLHEQPDITNVTGTEYKITVNIPLVSGKHTLYLVANHPINTGTITTLDQLKEITTSVADAPVNPPFVMATEEIELANLNVAAIQGVLKNNNGKFNLKRNVAKFSIKVTAPNFELNYVEWKNCPTSASVLLKGEYQSPNTKSMKDESLSKESAPVYFYQIQKMKANPHEDFHVLVGGRYTTNGTSTQAYYKLRLCTEGADGTKKPLTSIEGNSYYRLDIRNVLGSGASTITNAEQNGFSNDMEAVTTLDFTGNHDYRETYFQSGYQLGFSNSHWQIYSSSSLQSYTLGYFYRTIRDTFLTGYTTLDPDYPGKERRRIIAKENRQEISGMKKCLDALDTPVEMELCFTDSLNKAGKYYTFTSVIQYGILQKSVTIERHPSLDNKKRVLAMLNMNYGEILPNSGTTPSWLGLAAQRHDGATSYPQLSTDNDNIFIHIQENTTKAPREAAIQLFGSKGYSKIIIRQEP